MTGMEVFNVVVGISSIVSMIIALFALKEVSALKIKINSNSGNSQLIKGNGNTQVGHDYKK